MEKSKQFPNLHNAIIQKLSLPYAEANDLHVDIKRDDLIHPVISGNKWRKLHLIFEEAENQGIKTLVTFGGAFSNHMVATACASQMFGFESIGIIRGEEKRPLSNSLALCKWYGMQLKFKTREEYRDKQSITKQYKKSANTLVIDEGGRDPLAAKGAESIVDEIEDVYDYIALPVGTATTLEGVCNALEKAKSSTKVLAFSALKNNEADKARIERHQSRILWFDDTKFGGYAKFNVELVEFIESTYKQTGILLDPVYQGKMHFRLKNLMEEGFFKKHSKILCLHTGGDLGIYSPKMQKAVTALAAHTL